MTTTPNMGLDKPVVSATLGPEWATLINAMMDLIDAHDHSDGKGVEITPAGMLINAALAMNNNRLANSRSLGLADKDSVDSTDTGTIQRIDGNLYWVTPSGVGVQLTNGTSIVNPGTGALSYDPIGTYPYNVVAGDSATVKGVDTTSARAINLPAATNAMYVYFKDISSQGQTNPYTVNPNGADFIDGVNSGYVVDWNNSFVGFISDGVSNWWVM